MAYPRLLTVVCRGSLLPIMTAAAGGDPLDFFTNGTFITNLAIGAVGTLASALAGSSTYLCNLIEALISRPAP
jgi:hypothetical protein